MNFNEITNQSNREFKDISSEIFRTYEYPGCVGTIKEDGIDSLINIVEIKIFNPIGLHISKSGHYVIDSNGTTHFMPSGFIHLYWKATPNIVC